MIELLAADWNHWPDGLSPDEIVATAAGSGVDGLELGVYDTQFELAPSRMEKWQTLGERLGVPVRMLLYSMPSERWPNGGLGSETGRQRLIEQTEELVRIAAALGLTTVGLWPGADLADADHHTIARTVGELSTVAAREGIRLALEPKPGTALGEPDDVIALSEAAPRPDCIGVLLDTGHEFAAGRDPAELARQIGKRLFHIHLGDSDGDPDADLPPGRLHPLDPFFDALEAEGYAGMMTLDAYGAVAAGIVSGAEALNETVRLVSTYKAVRRG
ncbi:MAG: sugar phosphate isomerase/epimerase family protein [Acidimicrobiia bacterium]